MSLVKVSDAWPWAGGLGKLPWLMSNLVGFGTLPRNYTILYNNERDQLEIITGTACLVVHPGEFVWTEDGQPFKGTLEDWKKRNGTA